ncbi:MAG: hypothetical protein JKX69_06425 [Rhodobacteraceae bacterium]|nr:hypothetical protein [Paracoccaceae bacterium]
MGKATRIPFVVGTGASAEFGLPVGDGLYESIAKSTNNEFDRYGFTTNKPYPKMASILDAAAQASQPPRNKSKLNNQVALLHKMA